LLETGASAAAAANIGQRGVVVGCGPVLPRVLLALAIPVAIAIVGLVPRRAAAKSRKGKR